MQIPNKAYYIFFFLLIQNSKGEEVTCANTVPKSAADCKLSSSFPDMLYKYCCFQQSNEFDHSKCERKSTLNEGEQCYNETNMPPNDCNYILPEEASDCALSENDKKKYDYCCYRYENGRKSCVGDKKDTYELSKSLYEKADGAIYDCQVSKSSSSQGQDCESISPEKSSDCKLSDNEKSKYDYCCYLEDSGEKSCNAETKESYEAGLELFNAYATKEDVFVCDGYNNGSSFIIISNILFGLIILLNL